MVELRIKSLALDQASSKFALAHFFSSSDGAWLFTTAANLSLAYVGDRVVLKFTGWIAIGDLNGDGVVDVSDLLMLLGAWGPCAGACPADLNGDLFVDVSDLLLLLGNWG